MKTKHIKSSKLDNNYEIVGSSDFSSNELVSKLSNSRGVLKKHLVDFILKDIYGTKGYFCLKKQEPYFYNGLKEAILQAYNLGKLHSQKQSEDKK